MTENKRFYKAYCCGDTGVIDKVENEWFIENINSISDIEKNWDTVIDKLNQVAEENEQLKDILKDITIQLDANHTMNTYQMIIPINRVIYNELNRRLKETSFNEELRMFLDD